MVTTREIILSLDDLHHIFKPKRDVEIQALRGINLEIQRGQVFGLVGPDGAGKTTLLRVAAGLLVPSSGSAQVLGLDSVNDTVAIRGRIGYMPQKFGLYQDLTVQENLDLYADLQGVTPRERKQRYPRLTKMTGLREFTDRLAGKLSGGMKQKLGLACALIKSPELLLLDEPTVGVDPVSRRELWKIVYELVEQDGTGVLVSTAYLDEAERCQRVAVMLDGEKVAEDTPDGFRRRLEGRVFQVTPASQREARQIQSALVGQSEVIDATIRSGRVRIVTKEPEARIVADSLQGVNLSSQSIAPVFEDAFMSLVQEHENKREQITPAIDVRREGVRQDGQVVVQVHQLCKRFGDFEAVKGVTFDVHRGEIFGLLGPNGAGKSTTFRMLCGLLRVSEGDVLVAGHDLRRSASKARSRLGYMAQQFSLYGSLSVFENLRFFGTAYGLFGRRLEQRINWALDEFGLRPHRDGNASSLPGGYKQRLAMAVALLHEPEILFLDEPTSGVDPLARREFWRRITAVAESGVTVIVTTHFMEEAEYCDRMLIMVQGSMLALGTPAEIRDLARDAQHADPTIEDAFIALAERSVQPETSQAGNRTDPEVTS